MNILEKISFDGCNFSDSVKQDLIQAFQADEFKFLLGSIEAQNKIKESFERSIGSISEKLWSSYEINFIKNGTTRKDTVIFAANLMRNIFEEIFVSVLDNYK